MSTSMETIHIQISLTEYGDALIYGFKNTYHEVPGLYIKQRLFAWHEASFYGTELEIQQVQDLELVILPAEQVVPFFAGPQLLQHIDWAWEGDAAIILKLAPMLAAFIEERKYIPSFSAFRAGELQWTWDLDALTSQQKSELRSKDVSPELIQGLQAAFSAAVSQQVYGTEAAAADLRRDYPLLLSPGSDAFAGIDAKSWLVAIGWKADTAPFRPMLQLLEPDEDVPAWRLRLVLQDKLDPAKLVAVRLSAGGGLSGEWPEAWTAHVSEQSAGWLERLRACLPAERFAGGGDDLLGPPLNDEAAWRFLTADSRRLLDSGWQVLLPGWWEAASRKKPRLRAKVRSGPEAGGAAGRSLFGLDSLIDFDWRIAIGETDLTEDEFQELVARNERLVQFRGQWVQLDPALLAQIQKAMASVRKKKGLSFRDVLHLHLTGGKFRPAGIGGGTAGQPSSEEEQEAGIGLEVELDAHLNTLVAQLGQQSEWPLYAVPAGLQANLRNYQREGFSWLAFLRRFGLGACLADDMGLGKTVQLISYLLHLKETSIVAAGTATAVDSALVAMADPAPVAMADSAPLRVAANGSDPASAAPVPASAATPVPAAAPSLIICPTSVLGNWQKEISKFAPSLNVILHYGSKRLSGEEFHAAVAQADIVLTSFATSALDQELLQQVTWSALCLDEAQNIKNAQTKQSAAVRSIPALHRVALTGTPIENRLSELWSIYDFMNPGYLGSSRVFQEQFASVIEKERDEERTAELQKLVKPFMLRRKKKDPSIQLDLPDKNEMKTYIHLTAEQSALYDQTVNNLMEQAQKLKGIERKGAILSALTQLKQLCDHPILVTKEAMPEFTDPAETVTLIERSAKLERLLAMVKELREEGERCLIFTQYIGMGQMIQSVLQQELQEPVLYLNGSTSKTARDRMIEQFQAPDGTLAEQPCVFILSLKAGGVGLNLTAANHVFHFDRWWNPAVENQATDRAYRMGQTRDVQVHKFISLGTLEERIDEMLESKQQLSDDVISTSEGWITELSTDALRDLFTLRREWVR